MPSKTSGSDGPTVSLSFANNFWGKEDAGVGPLLDRMHNAKVTSDELKAFYAARAQIEEDYAKKILNLARKSLGSCEIGTLRMSLDVVRGELESMGKAHATIAAQMRSELEEPLVAFTGGIKERRKIVQGGIEKLLKTKNQQTWSVNKARDRFEQDCLKIKGYLAQGHMVMGQEERKNKAKLEKTQIQMSANSGEYETAVKVLEETTGRWNREWKAACDKFQDLEEERLDFFKSSLWSFANIASTVCVSDDQSCEKVRLSLEDCEVEKDITTFIQDFGTGQEIPDPPKYINFCRGDIDDAMSSNDSDDGNYSVAQFARTINPTYRTSSPQPSTLESHHDPDSSLREEMGLPKARTSIQAEDPFMAQARSSQSSAAAPPPAQPAPSQPPMAPSNAYADAPQIPHNPYPVDGMTQFCRMGPPSERSSIPSPTRPGSRDSQDRSDYSAPTSFSSVEPVSGNVSPIKQYNGSDLSGVSSGAEDKQIQKKKSGFFNSPFRRRSQKSKDPPQPSVATSASRNTWAPAPVPKADHAVPSPIKPFGASGRANTWSKQPSPSPDPDPVDPRAEYQLGIGNNVFDVASPDSRKKAVQKADAQLDLDPIAQALAELKGVTKQASMRTSADRHYGMSTPAPGTPAAQERSLPPGAVPTPFANSSSRSTPPPAYDPPVSRLNAPQPAHTSREMQKTAERFHTQKRDMFNPSAARPGGSSMARPQGHVPRATSPAPPRATSPRPFINNDQRQQQPYRAASPNPYVAAAGAARPRAHSTTPTKPQPQQKQPAYGAYSSSRGNSPSYQAHPSLGTAAGAAPAATTAAAAARAASPNPGYQVPRAASPNPAYTRPATAATMARPPSSRGSDHGGGGGGGSMALQLAPAPSSPAGDPYIASQRMGRPQSQYYPDDAAAHAQVSSRVRSQSVGAQRQYTKDGRPILHYARAMYMYQAAIPEELSFAKGDVLAITRHQDDGWWEAEVVGKNGDGMGLVPSNYLKNC